MIIIKIGGNIIDNNLKLNQFLTDLKSIQDPVLLIHGGGKLATELSKKLGIETKMVDGKRLTDAETLKIVSMVYAGWINKNIVAQLQALGKNACGFTGADLNIIPAKKRVDNSMDWGFVGDIEEEKVQTDVLLDLVDKGILPVFCAITHDQKGQLLNTNADTIAAALALSLAQKGREVSLTYCFEKKGVLADIEDENSVIPLINQQVYADLKTKQIVHSGMLPKLDNAFESLKKGVKSVRICMAEDIKNINNAGTQIVL